MEEKAKYYNISSEEVLNLVKSSKEGINENEVNKRLQENGHNKLKETKKKSMLSRFIDQFKNIMIIILLISAALSAYVGIKSGEGFTDAIIIFIVVMLNAILGVVQESKAEAAIEALKKMSLPYIKVRRAGKITSVKTEDIVVGDVVILEAGDFVPADMRIIENASMRVEEATLTGESLPIEKFEHRIDGDNIILAERKNMVYSGSSVVYGRAEGVVIGTGMNTELGKIAAALNMEKESLTPLQIKIGEISKVLSILVVIIAVIMFVVGWLQGDDLLGVFMIAVSLAVAAIPEGLPAVITITLAIGVQKMAKKNAIVRKLSSVEALGATQVICSDKTGTLTQNKMTVTNINISEKNLKVEEVESQNIDKNTLDEFFYALTLCNDSKYGDENGSKVLLGDPTETALVTYSEKFGYDKEELEKKHLRMSEVPFDSERKMMTTINKFGDSYKVMTKGATESILERCTHILVNGVIEELGNNKKQEILTSNSNMAQNALRVLAIAYKKISEIPEIIDTNVIERDLIFVGLVGMIDPPRPEAKMAVERCFNAGMIPVMITGDNKETAIAIATELGILKSPSEAITGAELDKLSDEEFKEEVLKYRVYARVSPENKVRIVKAWKSHEKIVAMTGDGVNDAPALKAADIGIGMGITGTEVSKSVSSMILTDDNFSTIVSAVKEGRRIYNNIQNVIVYLLSSNLAEVLIIFIATLFGQHILLPIQLLWINLISDTLPAITIGMEKAENNIMKQKPRKSNESFFTPLLSLRIILPSIIKTIGIIGMYLICSNIFSHDVAMTMTFIGLALEETLYALSCKSEKKTMFGASIFSNKALLLGVVGTITLQYIIVLVPYLRELFGIVALTGEQHLMAICVAVGIVLICEVIKLILAKIFIKEDKNK